MFLNCPYGQKYLMKKKDVMVRGDTYHGDMFELKIVKSNSTI
jgi:hypothetical protein